MTFNKALVGVRKDEPSESDVHIASTDWGGAKQMTARSFKEVLSMAPGKLPDIGKKAPQTTRSLKPIDDERSHSPFPYDANFLGSLRPDQQPRYYGAMTDPTKQEVKTVPLAGLVATQDRVDHNKVQGMRGGSRPGNPLVIHNAGTNFIADGHHGLAADWMDGKTHADVHFKDITDMDQAVKRAPAEGLMNASEDVAFKIAKVDEGLGLVFGWAIVCKVNGEDYYDLNIDTAGPHAGKRVPEHIPEGAMTKAAAEFMEGARPGNDMHAGPDSGQFIFAFPLTTDIAKAMNITTEKTGLMVAYKAAPDVLAKFKSGEYTGFSIEGSRLAFEEHD